MPVQRTAILRGPAIVTFNGATFYSQGDIDTGIDRQTFDIITSAYGKVDERDLNVESKVSFTPAGEWENIAVLFPYYSAVIGTSIFGADKPLVIHTLDGKKLTFAAAAVTKMPDLILSASKTPFGAVEFTCIRKDNTAWSAVDNFLKVESVAFADTSFNPANILTQTYSAVWGNSAPWNTLKTKEGFVISHELGLDPLDVDDSGNVDYTFASLAVMARCIPVGVTETDLITALGIQGAGAVRGRSLSAVGNDLVITGVGGQVITVKKAALKTAGYKFGASTLRIGEAGFVATRTVDTGVLTPLVTIA